MLCISGLSEDHSYLKFVSDIPGYNVDANGHESVALALDNYLKSMVSIYSEMGVLKVAKQNQQKLSSFDQVRFNLPIWLTTH